MKRKVSCNSSQCPPPMFGNFLNFTMVECWRLPLTAWWWWGLVMLLSEYTRLYSWCLVMLSSEITVLSWHRSRWIWRQMSLQNVMQTRILHKIKKGIKTSEATRIPCYWKYYRWEWEQQHHDTKIWREEDCKKSKVGLLDTRQDLS